MTEFKDIVTNFNPSNPRCIICSKSINEKDSFDIFAIGKGKFLKHKELSNEFLVETQYHEVYIVCNECKENLKNFIHRGFVE